MKRYIAILLTINLTAALFAGGAKEEPAPQLVGPQTLKVAALKGPTAFSMIKMFEEAPALGENVTTEFELLPSPDAAVAKLVQGELDIAVLPLNLTAVLYNKDLPYRLGATTGSGVLYLVTTRDDVNSWQDLAGRTVYNLSKGATPDLVFSHLLRRKGLTPGKDLEVNFSYSHTELAPALIEGLVDTAVLPEPFVTMVLAKNPEARIALDLQKEWQSVSEKGTTYPMTGLLIKDSLAAQPELVAAFLDAYRDSVDFVTEYPTEGGALVEKHKVGLPASLAAKAIPRLNISLVPAMEAKEAVMDYFSVLFDQNPASIGGKLPDANYFYQP